MPTGRLRPLLVRLWGLSNRCRSVKQSNTVVHGEAKLRALRIGLLPDITFMVQHLIFSKQLNPRCRHKHRFMSSAPKV
jgi:hypothetical protein